MRCPPLVFLLLVGMGVSGCAIPRQVEIIEREQRRLRADYGVIRDDLDSTRSNLADTGANLARLQAELGTLRGRLEEAERQTDRQIGQSTEEGNRRLRDMEDRLARLENELKTQEALLRSREDELRSLRDVLRKQLTANPPIPAAAADSEEERRSYEDAFRLLEQKDYRASIGRFQEFVKKYPDSTYADNAHYWIGESHYAVREFDQAILEFDVIRRKYPQGDKVPAALLKMGFAFAELGAKSDARLILQELIDRYPQSEEAGKAKQRLGTL